MTTHTHIPAGVTFHQRGVGRVGGGHVARQRDLGAGLRGCLGSVHRLLISVFPGGPRWRWSSWQREAGQQEQVVVPLLLPRVTVHRGYRGDGQAGQEHQEEEGVVVVVVDRGHGRTVVCGGLRGKR